MLKNCLVFVRKKFVIYKLLATMTSNYARLCSSDVSDKKKTLFFLKFIKLGTKTFTVEEKNVFAKLTLRMLYVLCTRRNFFTFNTHISHLFWS